MSTTKAKASAIAAAVGVAMSLLWACGTEPSGAPLPLCGIHQKKCLNSKTIQACNSGQNDWVEVETCDEGKRCEQQGENAICVADGTGGSAGTTGADAEAGVDASEDVGVEPEAGDDAMPDVGDEGEAGADAPAETGPEASPAAGDMCLRVQEQDSDPVDVTTCSFKIDGAGFTADADSNGVCQGGALFMGLSPKVTNFEAACPGILKGSLLTAVLVNTLNQATITVSPDPDTGCACLSIADNVGQPLVGCTIDWMQLPAAAEPEAGPPPSHVTCEGTATYFFDGIDPGMYSIAVFCTGWGNASGNITIEGGNCSSLSFFIPPSVPDGDLCTHAYAFSTDLDVPTLDLQSQLGYGVQGGCDTGAIADYTSIAVVDLTGPNCTGLADQGCRLTAMGGPSDPLVGGIHQHLLWTANYDGMATDEVQVFTMSIEDAGTQQSIQRAVAIKNGDILGLD